MIIPFFIPHAGCPHQCVFCNQKSITGQDGPADPSSIRQTINQYLRSSPSGTRTHIAFYGGSFTALPTGTQSAYLGAVQPYIDGGMIESIRISTRPDALSADILASLRRHRVRTVELGVQSMNDRVLELSGRGQRANDTENAVALLRSHGFDIGLQLMAGLPGDTADLFAESVMRVIDLRPCFVRIYPTLVIKGTPLEALYRRGAYVPLSLDQAVDLCRDAVERFERSRIAVVRIGIQQTDALASPGTVVAGPYHPAFGQLVESSRYLERIRDVLRTASRNTGQVTVLVHHKEISTAIGQKRSNIRALTREFGCRNIRIQADPLIPSGSVEVRSSTA